MGFQQTNASGHEGNDKGFEPDEAAIRQRIQRDPRNASLHLRLGDVLKEKNLPVESLAAYSTAIDCEPSLAAGYNGRAILLAELNGFDQALADHLKATELSPRDISFRLAMIRTCQAKGDYPQAERCCRAALEIDQYSAEIWEQLGRVFQAVGRFDEAADCFRRSLEIQPSGYVSMLLSRMPRQTKSTDEQRLIDLLNEPDLLPRDRAAAGFALGDILDQADRFDEAFAAYAAANAKFKEYSAEKGEYFDGDDLHRKVDEIIQTITPEYFQRRSDFGQISELPVFIVGMPRSGTSLVEQIAASHSKVFGAGELAEISNIRARLSAEVPPDSPRHWHRHWHRHLAKVHLARLAMLGGDALRVTDKMPMNIMHLGLIATMFPGARVIVCQRSPLATCVSCYFQIFEKHNMMFSYDLADCGRQYLEQERLSDHWKKVLPIRLLTVQYEELVSDLENQSRRLIDFLGLDWEHNCLEFHKTERPILTKSVWQARQPIYTRSVDHWRNYQKHLQELTRSLSGAPALSK